MKRIITLLLILAPLAAIAQEATNRDTVIIVGNRKLEVTDSDGKVRVKIFETMSDGSVIRNDQIFEGVYRDGYSSEQRFNVSVPFVKKKNRNKEKRYIEPHVAGFYMGYRYMGDGAMSFSQADGVDLVGSRSWEWGLMLFDGSLRLSNHFGLTSGLGFGYNSFRVDNNQAFMESAEGKTYLGTAPEGTHYTKSRLRYYHLRLPINVEFQKYFGWSGPLFISAGAEVEARLWVKSKAKYNGSKHTMGSDLNVRPLGLNFLLQAGYNDWGLYCRFSTASLFEKNKGPELYPYSVGIQWHW